MAAPCQKQTATREVISPYCEPNKGATMLRTFRSLRFLFTGPMILLLLLVINLMTSPENLWVKWAALGIGIAWVISLFRVITAAVMIGGAAALFAYLRNRSKNSGAA